MWCHTISLPPTPNSNTPAFILYRKEGSSSQELGIFIANVDCVKSFSKLNSILATHTSENAIYVSLSNIGCRADGGGSATVARGGLAAYY